MKGVLSLIVILLILLPEIALSDSWFGYVRTTGDYWSIYRHSNNMSLKLDQYIEGKIEPFEGPRGRVLSPYCSYFEDMNLNDIRLKQRTATLEGDFRSSAIIRSKSEIKSPVGLDIVHPADSDIYAIDFIENWPVSISAYKTLEYSGKGINNRDFSGNNFDFVGTNLLYNTELSKELLVDMELTRMNSTVLATDNNIILAKSKATRDLNFRLSTHITGIADIKYQQFATFNKGDERYYGLFNIVKNISMKSQFDNIKLDDDGLPLPCCYQGWSEIISFDKTAHSADAIFNCSCTSIHGVEP